MHRMWDFSWTDCNVYMFDQLRKYVMYTWGCKTLDESYNNNKKETTCMDVLGSFHCNESSRERRQKTRMDSICLNQKASLPSQKVMHYQFQFAISSIFFCSRAVIFESFVPWAGCESSWLDDSILQNTIQETRGTQEVKSCLAGTASTAERSPSHPKDEPVSWFFSFAYSLCMIH